MMIALFLSLSPPAFAEQAADFFSEGRKAFDEKQYHQAISHFLRAKALGMDKPALYYNLGASYYQLEEYEDARNAFLHVAATPDMADLGHYNLALIAIKQDDREEAIMRLKKTLNSSESEKLLVLAGDLLQQLGEKADLLLMRTRRFLAIGKAGRDSNVTLGSADESLGSSRQGDNYLDLFLHGSVSNPDRRLEVQASSYLSRYSTLNEYDFSYLRGGIKLKRPSAKTTHSLGAYVSNSYIGGNDFTRSLILETGLRKNKRPLSMRYEISFDKADASRYAYLEGIKQRLIFKNSWLKRVHSTRMELRFEHNNLADLDTGLTFSSYSPLRKELRLGYSRPIPGNFRGALDMSYRESSYARANRLSDGSSILREESRTRIKVKLGRKLSRQARLSLEYRLTDNSSTIAKYTYRREQINAGVMLSFN